MRVCGVEFWREKWSCGSTAVENRVCPGNVPLSSVAGNFVTVKAAARPPHSMKKNRLRSQ